MNIWGYEPKDDHRHELTVETADATQRCPDCSIALVCVDDYIGGGSHYWHLRCVGCDRDYTYDTYRFALERWRVWNGSAWVDA